MPAMASNMAIWQFGRAGRVPMDGWHFRLNSAAYWNPSPRRPPRPRGPALRPRGPASMQPRPPLPPTWPSHVCLRHTPQGAAEVRLRPSPIVPATWLDEVEGRDNKKIKNSSLLSSGCAAPSNVLSQGFEAPSVGAQKKIFIGILLI